jgi:hypothetical protein
VAEVLDLRRSGLGYRTIATQLNLDRNKVLYICHKHGLAGQIAEAPAVTEETVADYVDRSGFDYVGGYVSARKPITVRCRECGRTFERQAHIFRDVANGTWTAGNECPLCRGDKWKHQAELRERERREQAENDARTKAEQRAIKEADLISRQTEERLAIHICKNCGQEYSIGATGYNSVKYCSEKCMKRYVMRVKNDRRIRKLKTRRRDIDITLEKLFRRDRGVCYLCGGGCDWTDMFEGNAGKNYPSIDHVIPVAKGGTHTWDNIKLAHRKCNTAKRDSDYIP